MNGFQGFRDTVVKATTTVKTTVWDTIRPTTCTQTTTIWTTEETTSTMWVEDPEIVTSYETAPYILSIEPTGTSHHSTIFSTGVPTFRPHSQRARVVETQDYNTGVPNLLSKANGNDSYYFPPSHSRKDL
ncbi:hypothetical protein TWF106_003749 [Orbilia oligospora]|uniref:Uncharacterized protein n=1 Tax=Orbilia oligospora TaxID=2813651 RepID=A0A6G1MNC2_ORBOL|nr:hypothetical protein TWF788_008688 [Orbilia oligospora]KAF3199607.1 hypothetical protein TWF106_003749 [Orbilia oligospora]KAF3210327.1 hypothetical protein TWF679_006822 [Orbilia oligospora]KAF3210928.1 hypothetical protein TWF191_011047 [Orbilia oligospora]KAF3265395.1 hypothetical protein TWF192_000045 [Orbilia oligospora]